MNVIRIGDGLRIGVQMPEETVVERPDVYVLSPTYVARQAQAHRRQLEFNAHEWIKGGTYDEEGRFIPIPPQQAVIHRERYERHSGALRELSSLATSSTEAEYIPISSPLPATPEAKVLPLPKAA